MITYRKPAYAYDDRLGVFRKEAPLVDWMNYEFLSDELRRARRGGSPSAPLAPEAAAYNLYLGSDSFFTAALEGSILVDLGAGDPIGMLGFAARHGASGYIAVDVAWDYRGGISPPGTMFVNDDMLRFLFHLEDAKVNVCMNAIDELVLKSTTSLFGDLYAVKLVHEIARVTKEGGIAFGLSSPILHGLGDYGFSSPGRADGANSGFFGAIYRR